MAIFPVVIYRFNVAFKMLAAFTEVGENMLRFIWIRKDWNSLKSSTGGIIVLPTVKPQ